jgi:hypothetical protein
MRVALLVWVPMLTLSVALLGCSDKKDGGGGGGGGGGGTGGGGGRGSEAKKGGGPTAMVSGKGTLKGRITFAGTKPDLMALTAEHQAEMKKAQNPDYCLSAEAKKAGDADQQDWKIDEAGGVADVFVWLRPAKGTFFALDETNPGVMAVKGKQLVIEQPHCAFHPHASFAFPYYYNDKHKQVSTGQTILAKNNATIAHNTQLGGSEENDKVNLLLQPGKDIEVPKPQVSSTPIHVSCDIHKFMNANIWVVDSPYYAMTGKDGTFEIKNVPEGDVQLVVWHPKAAYVNQGGFAGEKITLTGGENTKDMTIKVK